MRIRSACPFVGHAFICIIFVTAGCRSATHSHFSHAVETLDSPYVSVLMGCIELASDNSQVSQREVAAHGTASDDDDPFAGRLELGVNQLVAEVLKRNPSIPAMVATWQAAAERYPQVISLDDPMFGFMVAPGSIGSND